MNLDLSKTGSTTPSIICTNNLPIRPDRKKETLFFLCFCFKKIFLISLLLNYKPKNNFSLKGNCWVFKKGFLLNKKLRFESYFLSLILLIVGVIIFDIDVLKLFDVKNRISFFK